MSNLKHIIEKFTIDNTTHGLARVLLEQSSTKECPCLHLEKASEDEVIPMKGTGTGTIAPVWQSMDEDLLTSWAGSGEQKDDDSWTEYWFKDLTFWCQTACDMSKAIHGPYHQKQVVAKAEELINNSTVKAEEVWELCLVRQAIENVLYNQSVQADRIGDDRKAETLRNLSKKLCDKATALFYPPDDAEEAGLKVNDHAIIVALDGKGYEFVHKKFEDVIAMEFGIDPSNKNANAWTTCVTYADIPGEAPNKLLPSGKQAGPGKTKYPGVAFRYDCITNQAYLGTNLYIKDIDHPLINSLMGRDNEEEIQGYSTITTTYSCNNGVCSDPGDGTGDYTTLVACQKNCKNIEGLQTIITPTPNPYPDLKIKFD